MSFPQRHTLDCKEHWLQIESTGMADRFEHRRLQKSFVTLSSSVGSSPLDEIISLTFPRVPPQIKQMKQWTSLQSDSLQYSTAKLFAICLHQRPTPLEIQYAWAQPYKHPIPLCPCGKVQLILVALCPCAVHSGLQEIGCEWIFPVLLSNHSAQTDSCTEDSGCFWISKMLCASYIIHDFGMISQQFRDACNGKSEKYANMQVCTHQVPFSACALFELLGITVFQSGSSLTCSWISVTDENLWARCDTLMAWLVASW